MATWRSHTMELSNFSTLKAVSVLCLCPDLTVFLLFLPSVILQPTSPTDICLISVLPSFDQVNWRWEKTECLYAHRIKTSEGGLRELRVKIVSKWLNKGEAWRKPFDSENRGKALTMQNVFARGRGDDWEHRRGLKRKGQADETYGWCR